ncbi:MAG: hypothetical protein HFACDABA_02340 [Anaerolineales bacterium]|nr:hypothetical protein [Anaerolineales bacterium]
MQKQIIVSGFSTDSPMPLTTDLDAYHSPLLNEWGDLQSRTLGGFNKFDDGDGSGSDGGGRVIKDLIAPWQIPEP